VLVGDEVLNVKIYSDAAPAVANIVTRTLEYDVFMEPVPVEGGRERPCDGAACAPAR
jgi:hypothetical protein